MPDEDRAPTPSDALTVYDTLYALAADGGRRTALFGQGAPLARQAFARSIAGDGFPILWYEIPLAGQPRFDLLSVHAQVGRGARFAPGAGFGYQAMFDWFEGICDDGSVSCGLEMDCGDGETERAGVYFQQRGRCDLVAPFMESVGESARAESYEAVRSRMPQGWPPSYVGLFPGRAGTPLRIGGYLGHTALDACAKDPAALARAFDAIGFSAYDAVMLRRCSQLLEMAPSADFQFDILEDGSLGDTFGLSLSFNETKPWQACECMKRGYGARFMETLESWGLADGRWRLIADAAFARHVPFTCDDGSQGRLALCVLFNYAKVKFTAAEAQPAKFYLILSAAELEPGGNTA